MSVSAMTHRPRDSSAGPSAQSAGRVCVVILNWNGLADTLACLESVLQSDYPDFQVVVCDNASSDGSAAGIAAWCRGERPAVIPDREEFRGMAHPAGRRLPHLVEVHAKDLGKTTLDTSRNTLVLIHTGGNLGYAGGNNCGIRYALMQKETRYLWILNNDTVVRRDALGELVRTAERDPLCGMCGSTLVYFDSPQKIQTLAGGWFNAITSRSGIIANGSDIRSLPDPDTVESRLAFIAGASMLVRRDFVDAVGPMFEGYFLYYEELDWAVRGRSKYRLRWAPASVVYHKEGGTIGTGDSSSSSPMALHYLFRNRMRFCLRHARMALPGAILVTVKTAFRFVTKGSWQRAGWVLGAAFGLTAPPTSRVKNASLVRETR